MKLLSNTVQRQSGQLCPACCSTDLIKKKGKLELKSGKYGAFLGCTRYPDCKYTCKATSNLENEATRLLKKKRPRTRRSAKTNKRQMQKQKELNRQKKQTRRELFEHFQLFERALCSK